MHWYKIAKEIGHGDTLEGQFLKKELTRISHEVDRLRLLAGSGGPNGVLPRWRADVRRSILLLPPVERIERMSMCELQKVSKALENIHDSMRAYSVARFKEIQGD